jgi:hypothetical protein
MVFLNKEAIAFFIPPMKILLSLQSFCNLLATLLQRDKEYQSHTIIKRFSLFLTPLSLRGKAAARRSHHAAINN